jgi:hypothetical protein
MNCAKNIKNIKCERAYQAYNIFKASGSNPGEYSLFENYCKNNNVSEQSIINYWNASILYYNYKTKCLIKNGGYKECTEMRSKYLEFCKNNDVVFKIV